ncbi:glyoxylase-like metal-dependent hydrolase (beta-lactamase superfamily II) [Antricoccus suffuscus]|uniref:Glyoxylase-like metal-dependent hydrolase (Beta-lactamase superfamily II) n=1 Tax=Antricoccus suffuscus TaxID=1629062 RepID=A0A2T1A6S1_9ACTN|nr:MBL fold metallo-hydrolase [Antricoccus suffuscus]PRZ44312.1 glyoxylase-like metal-dependent hydrolase (beta-lactamase superfamily II) [Antricoccus suffuscus]
MTTAMIELDVYTAKGRDLPNGGIFSPTTSTLVMGPREAVLVDTAYMKEDVARIARRIERSGRHLTTIYITHGHADHYFGIEWLLKRFPDARAVALPSVVADIEKTHAASSKQWHDYFGDDTMQTTVFPEPLGSEALTVDGAELLPIDVGQADIDPNTILHMPAIDAVIAGDVIYNGINPFLAASGASEWPLWIESVDKVAALKPRIVVAGHKRADLPDNDIEASVGATRAYISDFIAGVEKCTDSRELVARMQQRYPDYGNPSALILSAVLAIKGKKSK